MLTSINNFLGLLRGKSILSLNLSLGTQFYPHKCLELRLTREVYWNNFNQKQLSLKFLNDFFKPVS